MTNLLAKSKKKLPKTFHHLTSLIANGYEDSPLYLVALSSRGKQIYHTHSQEIQKLAKDYIEISLKALLKHTSLMWDEHQIITYLTKENPAFGKPIASIIYDELRYLREDGKEILDEFKYTDEFLSYFGLDMKS